jgi:serine/threonine protein kinase
MWSINRYAYVLANPFFYESLDNYSPNEDPYASAVKELLPDQWNVTKSSIWFHASPGGNLPLQGWKIHVSATMLNAVNILRAVVPVMVDENVPFKFAADPVILQLLHGKRWPRGSAGKFITIYPRSSEHFLHLIQTVHSATQPEVGPYILSDRRYPDSKCVFYRYGSFAKRTILRVSGEKSACMVSPQGQNVPDVRKAWCVIPDWATDPFPGVQKPRSEYKSLKGGRYEVNSVLHYSNAGGVYLGTDRETNARVVIKEGRPLVYLDSSAGDAIASLEKEYRILKKIEPAQIAPRPIDLFREWEHCFLVEEYLSGVELRHHATSHAFPRFTDPTEENICESLSTFKSIFISLTRVLSTLHRYEIAFRDLSPSNVMVLPDGEVKLVDFEAACERGIDTPTNVFTPGFAAADQFASGFARFESDYFSLGALMLLYMTPVHPMIGLDGGALERFAASIADDYGLPDKIRNTVLTLLSRDPLQRPKPALVIRNLKAPGKNRALRIKEPAAFDKKECEQLLGNLTSFLLDTATYDRKDRLFPSDPKIFVTNPLGVAYGACGVAYAINRISGELPRQVSDWILNHEITAEHYPPGLYIGMAGIAWTLLELGFQDRAEEILIASRNHPLLFESADLLYGLSGWGMANLKFYIALKEQTYLDRAVEAGEWILRKRLETDRGYYWNSSDGNFVGLGHGSSGVSLFLLYLYLATGEVRFLQTGEGALRFDLSHAVPFCGALSWPIQDRPGPTIVPYWRYGSAGVGTALLRFLHVTKDESLRPFLEGIFKDTTRKYAVFPGKFFGLAGLGEFLLDLAAFESNSAQYLEAAFRVASGIRLFQINSKGPGPAFPGFDLWKISCDYASGGSGIGLFLNRLVKGAKSDFMLDELIHPTDVPRVTSGAVEPSVFVS